METGRDQTIRILLVDDHPIVYEGLKELAQFEDDVRLVGHATDGAAAYNLLKEKDIDLVIIDISLADGENGLLLMKQLRQQYPHLHLLVLSMFEEEVYAERAIRTGARGYINKNDLTDSIIPAIRQVMDGKIYLSDRMSELLLDSLMGEENASSPVSDFSERELAILDYLAAGLDATQISDKLGVSVKTVNNCRSSLRDKLGLSNNRELTDYAVRQTMR